MDADTRYPAWIASLDLEKLQDPVWRLPAYRLALFVLERGWSDARALRKDEVTSSVAGQLYRALGSIGANIAEGYSRGSGRDRVRFYEYALGSARECIVWYRGARPLLGEPTTNARCETLNRIVRLLLMAIPRERTHDLTVTHD
jgi:four helix bundle protein